MVRTVDQDRVLTSTPPKPVGIKVNIGGEEYYINLDDGTATKVVKVYITKKVEKTLSKRVKIMTKHITGIRVQYYLNGKLITERIIPTNMIKIIRLGEEGEEFNPVKAKLGGVKPPIANLQPMPKRALRAGV